MKKITIILLIIFTIGLSILLYPSISQYWNSRVQSKAISNYEAALSKFTEEEVTDAFKEANEYNKKLAKFKNPLMEHDKLSNYNDIINVNNTGMMGYLSIDKLRVEMPIYHGTSEQVLNVAAGHMEGTSLPVGGESTHCVISAHRGLPSAKLFTDLDKMEVGDIFTVKILDKILTYQVDQVKIVKPDQLSDINIIEGEDYLTLLTCTPYGINTHRLLVRGKRIENLKDKSIYINNEAYLIDRLIVMPVIAIPILLILTLYVCFKPVKKQEGVDMFEDV